MSESVAAIEPEDYRQLVLFKLLLLAVIGAAVFLNSLMGVFVLDDERIADDPDIRSPALSGKAWLSSQRLVTWTLALNYAISEDKPWSYHLVNVALHVLSALVLFGLVCRTLLRQDGQPRLQEAAPWLAFLIALLWLVHPLQTQSVTYVSGRAELLAGLSCLLTLYCVLRGAEGTNPLLWYGAAVLSCALGMGITPATVMVPVVALLFDRVYLADSFADLWRRRKGLYLGLAACWALLALPLLAPDAQPGAGTGERPAPAGYVLSQPAAVLHYLRLAFWPSGLSFDYSDWPTGQSPGDYLLPLLIVGALLAAAVGALLRRPKVGFPGVWFFLLLAPAAVVPSAEPVAEQRIYLPLAGLVALVVLGGFAVVQVLEERQPLAQALGLGLAITAAGALGFLTFLRNTDYYSAAGLWQDTVARRPGNVRVRLNLMRAHLNLGNALYGARKLDQAAAEFQAVLDVPEGGQDREYRVPAINNLAIVLLLTGRADEALHALDGVSGDGQLEGAVVALNDVGFTRWGRKDYAAAERCFRAAAALRPGVAKYHFNRALALRELGKEGQAEAEEKEGLRLDPGWPKTARQVAWKRATDADPSQRNALQAVFLAQQAAQVAPKKQPEVLDTLAAAYASAGRFKEAVGTAEQAHRLAAAGPDQQLARAIQGRLELYKDQKPFYQGQANP